MPLSKQELIYTFSDYLTWPENERWELIDGHAFMQAAPSRQHQEISFSLLMQIGTYLKGKTCKVYHAPFCVRLDCAKKDSDINNVVEPDISIICDQSKLDERGCQGAPDMIIEIVSPSTGKLDKLIKFNKYESAGVHEYWIVEPDLKLVNVFILENCRYGRPEIYTEDDQIKVSIFSDLEIDIKSVFGSSQ